LEGPIGKRVMATVDTHEVLVSVAAPRGAEARLPAQGGGIPGGRLGAHLAAARALLSPGNFLWTSITWWRSCGRRGRTLYRESSDELREWVTDQSERLRRSAAGAIQAELARQSLALPKTWPGNKGKGGRLPAALRYLERHRHRLLTPSYASATSTPAPEPSRARCVISSGCGLMSGDALESRSCRVRFASALHLINGQWPAFENYIASLGEHFTLAPKPVPAELYARLRNCMKTVMTKRGLHPT
jgi:hypothetical protein